MEADQIRDKSLALEGSVVTLWQVTEPLTSFERKENGSSNLQSLLRTNEFILYQALGSE